MTTKTLRMLPAIALALACGTPQAQTKWDMPTPYVDGEFHTQNIRTFADEVKKATGGQLDIVVHSGQSLIKHPDMLRAVSTGQVNIAEFLLGQFGNEDPVFAADNLPFVATGYPAAFKFYQAQKPFLEKKLQARGLRLLYAVRMAGPGHLHQGAAEDGRRPQGHEVPHLQPADRAPRRAAGREPDRDPGDRHPAGIRDQHRAGDDHLVRHRRLVQVLGVRQELLHDERVPS